MNILANTVILYQTLPLFFAVTPGYRRLILAICSEDSRGAAEHVRISHCDVALCGLGAALH